MEVITKGDFRVIELHGEYDVYAAPIVKEQIAAFFRSRKKALVIDLSDSDYADASGLGVMIAAQQKAKKRGRDLVVINTNKALDRVFRITKLDHCFNIVGSLVDAEKFITAKNSTTQT